MNILWQKPNKELAITFIMSNEVNLEEHAKLLQEREDIPSDWILLSTNVIWEESVWSHECHVWKDGKVVVDLNLAKEETKKRLREERKPMWNNLDANYFKALESNTDTTNIIMEKNRLRNLPQQADTCQSLDNLLLLKV